MIYILLYKNLQKYSFISQINNTYCLDTLKIGEVLNFSKKKKLRWDTLEMSGLFCYLWYRIALFVFAKIFFHKIETVFLRIKIPQA